MHRLLVKLKERPLEMKKLDDKTRYYSLDISRYHSHFEHEPVLKFRNKNILYMLLHPKIEHILILRIHPENNEGGFRPQK